LTIFHKISSALNLFTIHPTVVEELHVDMKAVNLTDWPKKQPTNKASKQATNQQSKQAGNQPTNQPTN